MATSPNPQGGNGGPGRGGNSLAAIVKAVVSSVAAILNSWGKMPAVRTLPEYLGRKLPVWAGFGIISLLVGGRVGMVLAVGALAGLFFDTWLAARHHHRPPPAPPAPPVPESRPPLDPPRETGDAPGASPDRAAERGVEEEEEPSVEMHMPRGVQAVNG